MVDTAVKDETLKTVLDLTDEFYMNNVEGGNVDVKGNVAGVINKIASDGFSGAKVKRVADQTIANSVFDAIEFDNEDFDIGGYHDNVTNNTRLTAPDDGYYLIDLFIEFADNTTGARIVRPLINGTVGRQYSVGVDANGRWKTTIVLVEFLTAGQYIEFEVWQSSGGNLAVDRRSTLSIAKLGIAAGASSVGKHDLWAGAGAAVPITAGAVSTRIIGTGDNRKGTVFIPFTNGVEQFAVFEITLPRNFNNGTITVVPKWKSETEGAGTVIWSISAVAVGDLDDLAAAATNFGTAQTSTDTQTSINTEQIAPRTSAITIANTPADSKTLYIKVARDGVTDTFDQIAQLTGIYFEITTDAGASA